MTIEAMKQAVEHMQWLTPQGREAYWGLVKAIAEAEKKAGYCQACDGDSCTAKKGCVALSNPPEAEKQEPFGYFQYSLNMDAWVQNRNSNRGVPFYTSPPQRQPLVIDSDEKASAHMEKALWEFIDTASMFPLAKPDARTWPHVMVFAPQRQPHPDCDSGCMYVCTEGFSKQPKCENKENNDE